MKRMARVAAVGAAVVVLLLGATPAQATTAGAFAFVGNASYAPPSPGGLGLGYPIPNNPGGNGTWSLFGNGVGASANSANSVGTVWLNVAGSLHAGAAQKVVASSVAPLAYLGSGGFCGASGGSGGSGSISLLAILGPSWFVSVTNVGWVQSAGSLIVFQGDTAAGENYLAGVASAVQNATDIDDNCLLVGGRAHSFIVVGAGVAVF